jgi:predicted ester cyclase
VSIADNKAKGRQFFTEFDRRAFAAIPPLLAPGEVAHLPGAPQPLDWPAHQQYASAFVAAFPDCYHVIEDQIADADNVVTRLTFRGTHTGDLMGIAPTGRQIAMGGISWFRMSNGLIAEEWTEFDRLGLMIQLGVAPAPPTGAPPPAGTPDAPERLAALPDPRAVVGRWFGRVDRGGVPDVGQYVVDDYLDHNPPPIPGLSPGITGVRQAFPVALTGFGEFHHEIAASIAEGDKVASRVTGFGKHTGVFLGIPATGKQVRMTGISIHRVKDGKLAEHWSQIDAMSLLQQMGAIPPPA